MALMTLAACAPAETGTATQPPASATTAPTAIATQPPASATPTSTPVPSETPAATATETATATPSVTPEPTETAPPSATAAATTAATQAPVNTAPPTQTSSGDFAPTASSVWNTTQTGYTTNGGCASSLSPPYGLVEIAPVAGGLFWNDQAPHDYVLAQAAPNVYQYAGPTGAGDGALVLGLTFSSATAFNMSRTFSPASEPGCAHTHTYAGVFQWYR